MFPFPELPTTDFKAAFFLFKTVFKSVFSIVVNNYKESEVSTQLQANKIAFYSFTDAGRRHEMLRSETRDTLTHGTSSISIIIPLSTFLTPNPKYAEQ